VHKYLYGIARPIQAPQTTLRYHMLDVISDGHAGFG
jgi:hypothetical protein